ncbi:MAG: hypothetical protein PHI85_03180 [Victivallaceae bacterium]|nr:hypothetical protein [Victivallaceae bacterium]
MMYAIATFLKRLKRNFFSDRRSFDIHISQDGSPESWRDYPYPESVKEMNKKGA